MSWSLDIDNGDLVFGGRGLNTVTGGQKLVQDLRCALLESSGNDPLHPAFGSTIDGGIDSNGITQTGVIGQANNDASDTFVSAEVQRVCRVYQGQQVARNAADVAVYGKSTLTADEALLTITSIIVQRALDKIMVNATIQTGTGALPLAVPFSSV